MSEHTARVSWIKDNGDFLKKRYSRQHIWQFDGGISVPASASPHIVPLPLSSESAVDPEEAYVAALASCHMLFFLDGASQAGYVVETYNDNAIGVMAKNQLKQLVMTQINLYPKTQFSNNPPSASQLESLHHQAHQRCFLANSVKTQITVHLN